MKPRYDVVICGASIAGCTAATLYARRGARVALVERRADPAAYKVLCTHFIQPCGQPVLSELGLIGELEAAGAVRNAAHYWTRWGWIRPGADGRSLPYGYNVRRETLDPMLRRLAAGTPGVDLLLGHTVQRLLTGEGGTTGVVTEGPDGPRELRARLVVGADGRDSTVAKLAGLPAKEAGNGRFSYFAQFRGLPRPDGDTTYAWFREPDVAYAMPNDDDVTVIAVIPSAERLAEFRDDLPGAYRRFVASLPNAPSLYGAEQVSKIIGTVHYPLVSRAPVGDGLALIGDAALTSDPLWGVGCGWALQSAQWLVEATAEAVQGLGSLPRALTRYRRKHRSRLHGHQHLISDYAGARPFNPIERLMFSAAARDAGMAEHMHLFGSRLTRVRDFLSPVAMARAAAVNLRHKRHPRPELVPTHRV
ncbi:2-octaprenyl-3-methyl-6-methoxy-1,4-benzoquinol hydroxylase [Paractinoplanes deccanensis]|uniref:2-octaprenyl-3-methyl-6-methoxy-1,4-benzoquinol hydroxylase n=1 Tax=Paractinoplanes deccanensis TaxID=113561 RepID=A0ABQ3XY73_9ACTN|nr:NAD(P)/FAD-dependent oxidoreductase [Actinoplanes deccanensis]GID72693.1 2-octaprenyl-3-methyl-6-methoxy-1,4-benzoquinol hydroxylase [Actinoplanes deccanensis]